MTLGGSAPALVAHPDWRTASPFVVWLHGRTVQKELDPGRYLRWIRAGIGVVAIDLPGHGERAGAKRHGPEHTLDVIEEALGEIDGVVAEASGLTGEGGAAGVFDGKRVGIGGMSLGGMITLRRLCDPHGFACAAVEGTTGWLERLYFPPASEGSGGWPVSHAPERVRALEAMSHLEGWRAIPLLALHSEADEVVGFEGQRAFIGALRARYESRGADPGMVELVTWPETGAPAEHAGFGRFANDAKNAQTAFLARHLGASGESGQAGA